MVLSETAVSASYRESLREYGAACSTIQVQSILQLTFTKGN